MHLVLGGQAIKAELVDLKWVPRLGLVYQFSPNTGMKALYGQAYRSAFQVETVINAPTIKGNPAVAPQKPSRRWICKCFIIPKSINGLPLTSGVSNRT
jgi:hypothetical protein